MNPEFPGSVVQNPNWVFSKALSTHAHLAPVPLVFLGITVGWRPALHNGRGNVSDHLAVRVGLLVPVAGVFTGSVPRFALLYATGTEVRGARLCPGF